MTTLTPDTTLAEVISAHPSLARELERRGLDYCCGGSRTIQQACASNGLDAGRVVTELTSAAIDEPEAPWSSMDLVQLIDHVETTHHRYLWEELPRLSALADKIVTVHGGRHPELAEIRSCYEAIRADLEPHLIKEERVLFPMLRELATADAAPSFHCGTVLNPISVMLREHESVGELLRRLRTLTDDFTPPADGCGSYVALFRGFDELETDTHLHIHKENFLLFPEAERVEGRLAARR